jgi:ABC-type bacteriocin/lantibiotic exporter with double-glycine peptidase domain
VKIHGVDVRDIEVSSLRSRVHLVRGREILADTIENNISCLRPEVGTEQVLEALEKVRLLEHVQKLPDGIRTQLSSVGNPLSSGQVAQLMLARAIAGRPGVLVLDETLDVIDSTLLKGIYSVLLDPAAPWTLIDLTSDPVVWGDFAQHYRLSTHGLERIEPGASTERLKVTAERGDS